MQSGSNAGPRTWFRAAHAVVVISLLVAGCGSAEPANPYTVSGQVFLDMYPDGGSSVSVTASVGRTLDDGGSDPVVDAGVALNGMPLGAPARVTLDAGSGPGTAVMTWSFPSLSNAVPMSYQVLSVIGSNPPASIGFACPDAISITSPMENAVLDGASDVIISWTKGGDPAGTIFIDYAVEDLNAAPGTAAIDSVVHVDAGTTSYDLDLSHLGFNGGYDVSFDVQVPGGSPDMLSVCYVVPYIDLHFR